MVAEVVKTCRTWRLPVDLYWLRSHDGREIDLLVERDDGYFAFEVKGTRKVGRRDHRHLRGLESVLDKPLLAGLVVSDDPRCRRIEDERIWAVEAARLFC